MREILFRGKRPHWESWVEGFYVHVPSGRMGTNEHLIQTVKKDGRLDILYEVYPETVGQFTGLVDKAGKRIFEGDIVSFGANVYVVKYIEKYSRFSGTMPGIVFSGFPLANSIVIGNIHDNPELWRTEK